MRRFLQDSFKNLMRFFWIGSLLTLVALAAVLVSCGGYTSFISTGGMGTINVSITDPPSCAFPNGSFQHVYVTIRSVQAHTSATADDNSAGWQELAPQLASQPMQIDLFAAGSNSCMMTMLGLNTPLPAGNYQQIRLLLVPNDGGGGPVPANNQCNGQGFNCVVLQDGSIHELNLSSQANTGLKIPPGKIVGGPISVGAGQTVDLNIDFNACASIIMQGNGKFRLKPVLTAAQVSTSSAGISGQVVDAMTKLPIIGGSVLVALEKPDNSGVDSIFLQAAADSSGHFNFCPLTAGATFDVVAVAIDGVGVAYNATIVAGVPGGTNVGAVPLFAESGMTPGPATFEGFVTATTGSAVAASDVLVSALQTITVGGGANLSVTIPFEGLSVANIPVDSTTNCPVTAPLLANCAQYTLIEPASNPSVGIFSSGTIPYSVPAAGDVLYTIRAIAFVPLSGGTLNCTPSSKTTNLNSMGNPLKAIPGPPITPKEIDFTGCS
jgi:hypothetical protein